MKFLQEFIESAPVNVRLNWGIKENIIISNIDTSVLKEKGVVSKKRIVVTLTQMNEENKRPIAESSISYWALTPGTKFLNSYTNLIQSLLSLTTALSIDSDKFYSDALSVVPEDIENEYDWLTHKLKAKDVTALQESICKAVDTHIVPILAKKPLLKCKVLVNNKGFIYMGSEEHWIVPMDGDIEVAPYTLSETRNHARALQHATRREKADGVGAPPSINNAGGTGMDEFSTGGGNVDNL